MAGKMADSQSNKPNTDSVNNAESANNSSNAESDLDKVEDKLGLPTGARRALLVRALRNELQALEYQWLDETTMVPECLHMRDEIMLDIEVAQAYLTAMGACTATIHIPVTREPEDEGEPFMAYTSVMMCDLDTHEGESGHVWV
jgi:hypothetical protein